MVKITGGRVYDPANGIDGVVKDVCIADGRIVAQADGGPAIDASGMIVFPGGVDVHTHVAGGALNFARGLVPENQRVARLSQILKSNNGRWQPVLRLQPIYDESEQELKGYIAFTTP